MEEEACPDLHPKELTLQRGHHSFAQSQHQAERGAKRRSGDLEVKAGGTGAPSGASEVAVGGQEAVLARRGSRRRWLGCCLQAACRGGCQCCCLRSPAQAVWG